jgi:hypothetical protein
MTTPEPGLARVLALEAHRAHHDRRAAYLLEYGTEEQWDAADEALADVELEQLFAHWEQQTDHNTDTNR